MPVDLRVRQMRASGVAIVVLSASIALAPLPVAAAVSYPSSFHAEQAPYSIGPSAITDTAWQKGLMGSDFFNVTTRVPSRLSTRANVLYDEVHLFDVLRC